MKLGVRDSEVRVKEVPVSGIKGHLSQFLTRGKKSRSCDLLARKIELRECRSEMNDAENGSGGGNSTTMAE